MQFDKETETILQEVAIKAVKEYSRQENKKKQKRIMHNTFVLMENYTSLKRFVSNAVSEQDQIERTKRFENNEYLNSIRKSRTKTMLMIAHIDAALKELKKETDKTDEAYKYDAFYMYYIKMMTYEQIQEELQCGKNSPARWCKEMIKRLSVKLFGIDGMEKW